MIVAAFAVLTGVLLLSSKESRKDTIIFSDSDTTVTMPSGKVVQTNQWFQRDSDTKLALRPTGKDNESFYLIEHLNLENVALFDSDGKKSPLILASMTSKSSADGHVFEYVARSNNTKAEQVGAGQPM